MSSAPIRPTRPKAIISANPTSGSLLQGSSSMPSLSVVSPGPLPANAVVNPLQKFAQLILYGIAMFAIWGGILAIAFAENSTNLNFLILGVGGLVSAGMAIALVEWQRKKGGAELHSVHDYLIGIGFFFSAVGVLWGSRWLIGEAASNYSWFLNEGIPYSDTDWSPSAEAIYVQLAACFILIFGQVMYLNRLKGKVIFGWSVATFTPLVLAIIGFGPWMRWSNDIVSWELGISIISLTAVSMWLSLRSNSGIIFAIAALASGIIPILYEMQNNPADDTGAGGALSLIIFIIIVQGWLAADHRLRQDLMQWVSIFLVGEVILAMVFARAEELNLILGPFRADEYGDLSSIITLQVVLWLTVLLAYFPATLKRRIPYMPIGLAASLFLIVPQASIIPWVITIIMLPYLLIISKITRRWVANSTIIAAGASFFLQSHFNSNGFYYEYFDSVLIIALLVTSEVARSKDKIDNFAHFTLLGTLVVSSPVLLGSNVLVPWTIVIYTIITSYLMLNEARENKDERSAIGASSALFTSMVLSVLLSFLGRLEVPLPDAISDALSGFNITLAIVGVIVYLSMMRFKETELDVGYLINMVNSNRRKLVPIYDTVTGNWIIHKEKIEPTNETKGWGTLSRMSLLGPLLLFSISVSSIEAKSIALDIQWIVLMLIPIGIIIKEVLDEKEASSLGRMVAIWLMVIVASPVAFKLNYAAAEVDQLIINGVIFDLMLLAGPLIVSTSLSKKGINYASLDESADRITLFGLLALGLIDSSGGILFITMYILVFSRALKHRQNLLLSLAPIAIILFQDRFAWDSSMIYSLLQLIDFTTYDPSQVTVLGITRLSCLIMASTALIILAKGVIEGRAGLGEEVAETPLVFPAIWLALGLAGILTEVGWLFVILTLLLSTYSWLSGRIELIPWAPIFMFISLLIGFASSSAFGDIGDEEIFSNSILTTGLFTLVLNQLSKSGLLYRWAKVAIEHSRPDQMLDIASIEGREQLTTASKYVAIVCLVLSWNALFGIGTLFGAIWITRQVFADGGKNGILMLPILHVFAICNLIVQLDVLTSSQINKVAGTVLLANGLFMTYLATKTEVVWKWSAFDWEDETEYFSWIDKVGISAIAYFLFGIVLILMDSDVWPVLWTLWAGYLIGIAIQGFRDETETPWRRGFGSFGSLLSLFMLSLSINTELFRYMIWMLIGIVAFGFGILYMNRMGEESTLYQGQGSSIQDAVIPPIQALPATNIQPIQPIQPTQNTQEEVIEEEVESEQDLAQVAEEQEEFDEELDKAFQDIEAKQEDISQKEIPAPVKQAKPLEKSKPVAKKLSPNVPVNQPLFDVQLDPQVLAILQQRIANTPHIGYRPVVQVMKNGNINLTFLKV